MATLNLQALLKAMLDKGASDLHVTAGSPPRRVLYESAAKCALSSIAVLGRLFERRVNGLTLRRAHQ